jgi:SOS-response transcriptional repressor LexA
MFGGEKRDHLRAFWVPDDGLSAHAVCRGDIAIVEATTFARDGDIAVALVNESEAVLRKYLRVGADIELCSDEDKLRLPASKVKLLGGLKALIRPIA